MCASLVMYYTESNRHLTFQKVVDHSLVVRNLGQSANEFFESRLLRAPGQL